jgi:Ca2+-binding RTX toxin-like protein
VTVSDGTISCTATVLAGQCSLTFNSAGPRSLTATYAGDADFNGSTSPTEPHQVDKIQTTTTITSDAPDPSVVGQPVTVQYSVTPAVAGTPTGNVTVTDGSVSCTATVAAGQCSLTFTSAGAKTLTASYTGDTKFEESHSVGESHQVDKAETTTTVTSDNPDPSVVGQAVTVTYSVTPTAPGAGTPTGNVTVSDGTISCTATVLAGQCSLTFTTAGARSLTATYAGDADFNGSTSASETHQVDKADTTTTITSDSPDPSVVGQSVTVQYSVAVTAPGAGTPTGNVTVTDGIASCTATVAAGQCSITFASAGAKSLTATFAGDADINGSTSASESHQVNKADTTTTVTSDNPDPSAGGQSVTVQYAVAVTAPGGGTPTGNVTVTDGVDACVATAAAGQCSLTLTTLGSRTITATYAGDVDFSGSSSAGEPHEVEGIATTTTITSDNPDPSVVGQAVTVQYSVTPAGAGTPTGNVTVTDGSISCTATVAAGQCSITFTSGGAKTLTATYAGDSAFSGSTSPGESHQVDKADTATTITSDNPDPSAVGQSVTVQFTVAPVAPGAGTPTGNVTVTDGAASCTGTVAAGQCSLTLGTVGAPSLTATYAGDADFNGSTSAAEPHTVTKVGPTLTTAAGGSIVIGTGDKLSDSAVLSGGLNPTGTISFTLASPGNSSVYTNVVTVNGNGTYDTSAGSNPGGHLPTVAGTYTWQATYSGDANNATATDDGQDESQTVAGAPTTTTITSDTPDPTVVGQAVLVSYSVVSGAGTPTGNVTVTDGTSSCTATVAAGQCSITFTTAGLKSLTATYAGDSSFSGSTSAAEPHQVNAADTTTTITSDNPDPSAQGQPVAVHYGVTVNAPGGGAAMGTVTVSDGVNSCTATVAAGQCSITLTTNGVRTLTATYAGDSNFNGSTSAGVAHTVLPPDTPPSAVLTGGTCDGEVGATLTLTLFDVNGDPLALTLAANSNPAFVPNASIIVGGSGYTRTVTITASLTGGSTTITLNVSDGEHTAPFVVTIIGGTSGINLLNGTSHSDVIFGGGGIDSINGNAGNDLLCGGTGNDFLSGSDGDDILVGGAGVDTLTGGKGNDTLTGGDGVDRLDGGDGDDRLSGEAGADLLTGGSGADDFSGGSEADLVTDFNAAQGDTQDGTIP